MTITVIAILLMIIGACYMLEKKIDVTTYEICSEKISHEIAVAHLSDLHCNTFGENNERLIHTIDTCKPDVIVCTGDMINFDSTDYDVTVDLLRELSQRCPVYYSFGNHEYRHYLFDDRNIIKTIESSGAKVLHDINEEITIKDTKLNIFGLSQNTNNYLKYGKKKFDVYTKGDGYKILLAHHPELFKELITGDADIDLALAGHAHGGQVRILGHGLFSPDQGLFPKLTSGIRDIGGFKLIISRGLGDHTTFPRINNSPELIIIRLMPK